MAVFEAAEVTATPIYEIDQLLDDPHVQARGVLVEAPDDEAGSVLMHNIIPAAVGYAGSLAIGRALALGQHTRSVLESIGYDAGAPSGAGRPRV